MMKKNLFYLLAGAVVALNACARETEVSEEPDQTNAPDVEIRQTFAEDAGLVPGVAVVEFDDEMIALIEDDLASGSIVTKSSALNDILANLGIISLKPVFPREDAPEYWERAREAGLHRFYEVEYAAERPVTRAAEELTLVPGVISVEPRYRVHLNDFTDPYYTSQQWHYHNTANPGVDVNALPVWENYTTGNPSVIVSVVDQGVDLEHEDLAWNCLPGGPDGSFNFARGNYNVDPMPHGTHVAGTIAAVNGNGKGVCGIAGGDFSKNAPGVKIMSCQFFGIDANGSAANAIRWGADHGAVISQNSWGYVVDINNDGHIDSSEMERAKGLKIGSAEKAAVDYFIKYAGCDAKGNQRADSPMKGGIVIFSAGNDNIEYGAPANYEGILSVGAIDRYGRRSTFSNYGEWVDICAPGTGIYSTMPSNKYGSMNGTSMACPHVSGVAALVVSYCGGQGFTNDMLWTKLVNGASRDVVIQDSGRNIGPLVNALGAILFGDSGDPGEVTEYSVAGRSNNLDFTFDVPASSEGDATYAAMLFASKDRSALEKLDPSHPGSGVVSASCLTSTCAVGATVTGSIHDLEFDADYYVTMAPYSYSRVFAAKAPIQAAKTGVNHAPTIRLENDGEVIRKNYEVFSIPLVIEEPDGHEMTVTYKASSAADDVIVDVETGGYVVHVKGPLADDGTYTGVVTARDSYGMSASLDVRFTLLPNHAPKAMQVIPDRIVHELGETVTLDALSLFSDEDGEPLSLDVAVSDKKVAHVTRNGDLIYVTILTYGSATVTITATDAKKTTDTISFSVLVREEGQEVSVYPNQVVDVFYVATGETEEETEFSIYGASGALVYQQKHLTSAFKPAEINILDCAPGRYSVVFEYGGKQYNRTIVKK